ncbi:UNVERIFIED_CONTAM: hypothetical protein GTU68_001230 [Idotea baltica]|nr:hypothetical protein [Idotea baltica]
MWNFMAGTHRRRI